MQMDSVPVCLKRSRLEVEENSSKKPRRSLESDQINESVLNIQELVTEIFFCLNYQDLANCGLVCHLWKDCAIRTLFQKKRVIYQKNTFNPEDWNFHFNINFKTKECEKAFHKLPLNLKLFESKCPIFKDKKLGETHLFVWIPKGVSLKIFGMLLKEKYPQNKDGYKHVCVSIIDHYGDQKTEKSEWVAITNEVLPDSQKKHYLDQIKLFKKFKHLNYKEPQMLQAAICSSVWFLKSNIKIIQDSSTRCQENVELMQIVLKTTDEGLSLDTHTFVFTKYKFLGMAAMKSF